MSGSLIKHQLVTHLSLGMALRFVLDALRKPAESKVCVFLRGHIFQISFDFDICLIVPSYLTDVFVWKSGIGAVCGSSY